MKLLLRALPLLLALPLAAQSPSSRPDPWKALSILQGTWEAKTPGGQPISASGTYTFREELNGHILARHSVSKDGCKGPADFDCGHTDLLYAWQPFPHGPVSAIYFDNEGHVIHYSVSTPEADTVIFLSDINQSGPLYRLVYERKGDTLSGKFQMQMPGRSEWKSYLEWSGNKLTEK